MVPKFPSRTNDLYLSSGSASGSSPTSTGTPWWSRPGGISARSVQWFIHYVLYSTIVLHLTVNIYIMNNRWSYSCTGIAAIASFFIILSDKNPYSILGPIIQYFYSLLVDFQPSYLIFQTILVVSLFLRKKRKYCKGTRKVYKQNISLYIARLVLIQ